MKAGPFLFVCIICFVAGACMTVLALVCANRPSRKVFLGWVLYLTVCFLLAYRIGGALLL